MALEKQVILRGASIVGAVIPEEEEVAGEAGILPGHALAYDVDPAAMVRHGGGVPSPRMIALERDEIGKDLEVAYPEGDTLKKAPLVSGCTFNMVVAASQDLAKGDDVVLVAGGEVAAGSGANVIGTMEEDVTTGAGETSRGAVRIA